MRQRASAAQATLDRFGGKRFQWGKHDCVRMAIFHLRKMGHKPPTVGAAGYRSALGARRALTRAGFDSLAAALDGMALARIPMAAAVAGDIGQLPSDPEQDSAGLGALVICVGNGRWIGFVPEVDHQCVVFEPLQAGVAWRA